MYSTACELRSDRSNWREVAARRAPEWITDLRGIAAAIGGRLIDGDDLLSYAIERLLLSWERGAGPSDRFHGYLVRTMRNRVVDEARSPRARQVPLSEAIDRATHDDSSSPEHYVEEMAERKHLQEVMYLLPETARETVIESCVDGRTPADLALSWGVSANTAAQRVHRAKNLLRNTYGSVSATHPPTYSAVARASLTPWVARSKFSGYGSPQHGPTFRR